MDDRITELAHELRTPLAGVLGAIDLVTDPPVPLDETETAELLAVARAEANHLRAIIEGVVQRTRLDSGTLRAEARAVSALELVEEALARFPSVSDRTSIGGDTSLAVRTDPPLASQILTNLFQNISRYAPTGPVSVTLGRHGDVVAVMVTDTGPGLPGGEVPSSHGLGVGLSTSRRLANLLGGSLASVPPPGGSGASFRLELPACDEEVAPRSQVRDVAVVPPRARLLQEVADLLVGTSLSRILTGVGRLGREMLGATTVLVFERRPNDLVLHRPDGSSRVFDLDDVAVRLLALPNGTLSDLADRPPWLDIVGDHDVAAVTMRSGEELEGLVVVGWRPGARPGFAPEVLPALAALVLVGIDRRSLGAELDFERQVRAEVMDSLPIAISVFAGDPPRVIGANRAEREMLALFDDAERPDELTASQEKFDVRFEDGTPLDGENSPVVETIRTGRSTGPFYLRIRRADGAEIVTRTHCAPVRGLDGAILGAVVTSEVIGD
ncbi:MAG TPA: ATP-binding protein [Acidimicrobiia bacterium]|nr:ATP-binding protein [Acidimicrobiia bacterium]